MAQARRAKAKARASKAPASTPARQPKPRSRRNGKGGGSGKLPIHLLDAAFPSHLPGPRSTAKYVVHRNRVDISLATTTTDTVLVFGDFLKSASYQGGENRISPTLGAYGTGANVPGTTETRAVDPLLNGASSDVYSTSLHNLTVEVRCTGTSAGLIPPGLFYLGALPIGFDRTAYGTWATMATSMKNRPGMTRFTAYEALQKSRRCIAYPLDPVKFSEFRYNHGTSEQTDQFGGALSPIVVVLDANTDTQTSWTITIHAEWRMRSNVDPLIQSIQKSHAPAPESMWHKMSEGLSNVGGVINNGMQLAQTIGSIVQGARGIGLPALPAPPLWVD